MMNDDNIINFKFISYNECHDSIIDIINAYRLSVQIRLCS